MPELPASIQGIKDEAAFIAGEIRNTVGSKLNAAMYGGATALEAVQRLADDIAASQQSLSNYADARETEAAELQQASEDAGLAASHAQRVLGASSNSDTSEIPGRISKLADDTSETAGKLANQDKVHEVLGLLAMIGEKLPELQADFQSTAEEVAELTTRSSALSDDIDNSTSHM